jgi:hypothetical protein
LGYVWVLAIRILGVDRVVDKWEKEGDLLWGGVVEKYLLIQMKRFKRSFRIGR